VAVIVSKQNTNLTSNEFYRAESYNVGTRSGTFVTMTTTGYTLPLTFANAGNFLGISFVFVTTQVTNTPTSMRDVTLVLQENVASVWTDRVTTNLAATSIFNGVIPAGIWTVPIILSTPYAVDTAVGKWRVILKSAATGTTHWVLQTSDNTNPAYIAWCDNQMTPTFFNPTISIASPAVVSFTNHGMAVGEDFVFGTTGALPTGITEGTRYYVIAAGFGANSFQFSTTLGGAAVNTSGTQSGTHWVARDFLYFKDEVTVNRNFTTRAYLGTGDTVGAFSGWLGTSRTPSKTTAARMKIPTTSAPIDFMMDGWVLISSHSGVSVGSIASPISATNRVRFIVKSLATVGTGFTVGGFIDASCQIGSAGSRSGRWTFTAYGEVPAKRTTNIVGSLAVGATSMTVIDGSTFVAGDTFNVGKRPTRSALGEPAIPRYTVTSVVGNTVNFTPALVSFGASDGSIVAKYKNTTTGLTGFGIDFTAEYKVGQGGRYIIGSGGIITNFDVKGSYWERTGVSWVNINGINEEIAWKSMWHLKDATLNGFIAERAYAQDTVNIGQGQLLDVGIMVENVIYPLTTITGYNNNGVAGAIIGTASGGQVWVKNCICFGGSGNVAPLQLVANTKNNIDGFQYYHGGGGITGLRVTGLNCDINNIYVWGSGATLSAACAGIEISNAFNARMSNIKVNNCNQGISVMLGVAVNCTIDNLTLGDELANTFDFDYQTTSTYADILVRTTTGNPTFNTERTPTLVSGSTFKFTDCNVTNNDFTMQPFGFIRRTGYGLGDTTVWNGSTFGVASLGQFGMRLEPSSSTGLLTYKDNDGATTIGLVQNKTVTVTTRVKINNAAFYAGVHTKPTLKVTYDGSTVVQAVATGTTADQQLQVVFTPTTTNQAITIELNCATDATTTDAYVYLGEVLVGLPSGISVDTSQLGSWTNALPLGYTKTFSSPSSALDEPMSAHNISGSLAAILKTTDITVNNIKSTTDFLGG